LKRNLKKPETRTSGKKVKVSFVDEHCNDLIIPISEIFKALKKPEDFKYNKDLSISVEDFPKMVIKKLAKKSIHAAVGACKCKTSYCAKSEIQTEDIVKIRKDYWLKKNFDKGFSRNDYLKSKIESLWNAKEKRVEYRLSGRILCQYGFIKVIGCSKKKVQDIVKLCVNNSGSVVHQVSI
jgi:hypothetical protein